MARKRHKPEEIGCGARRSGRRPAINALRLHTFAALSSLWRPA